MKNENEIHFGRQSQQYFVGTSNQTNQLNFQCYFKQRPIQPEKMSNSEPDDGHIGVASI